MSDSGICLSPRWLLLLKKSLGVNYTVNNDLAQLSCDGGNKTQIKLPDPELMKENLKYYENALDFYAFTTPFIISIGLFGNPVILCVFLSKAMRKISASFYLASLALSDTLVLLSYVLLDWLHKGLHRWPNAKPINLISYNGMCQVFLLVSYGFRFMSVYLIVFFTIERYLGICKPLTRQKMNTHRFARRAIGCVVMMSLLISAYKPIISGVHTTQSGQRICGGRPDYERVNFILDTIYALTITALPFLILTIFNMLITRKLVITQRRHAKTR